MSGKNDVKRNVEAIVQREREEIQALIESAGIEDPDGKIASLCEALMIKAGVAGAIGGIHTFTP